MSATGSSGSPSPNRRRGATMGPSARHSESSPVVSHTFVNLNFQGFRAIWDDGDDRPRRPESLIRKRSQVRVLDRPLRGKSCKTADFRLSSRARRFGFPRFSPLRSHQGRTSFQRVLCDWVRVRIFGRRQVSAPRRSTPSCRVPRSRVARRRLASVAGDAQAVHEAWHRRPGAYAPDRRLLLVEYDGAPLIVVASGWHGLRSCRLDGSTSSVVWKLRWSMMSISRSAGSPRP